MLCSAKRGLTSILRVSSSSSLVTRYASGGTGTTSPAVDAPPTHKSRLRQGPGLEHFIANSAIKNVGDGVPGSVVEDHPYVSRDQWSGEGRSGNSATIIDYI